MDTIVPILVLALFVVSIVALANLWMVRRARDFLNNWADANGYEVGSAKMRMLWRGPYFPKSSKNQVVFRIIVADASGNVKNRLGSLWPLAMGRLR